MVQYLYLDGVDDYATIPDNSFTRNTQQTFEIKFSFKAVNRRQVLFAKSDVTSSANGFYINYKNSGNLLEFVFKDASGNSNAVVTSSFVPVVDTVYTVYHTVNFTTRSHTGYYTSGASVTATSAATYTAMTLSTQAWQIGRSLDSFFASMNANIAIKNVRVYNRILTTAEMLSNHNGTVTTSGLVTSYDMSTGTINDQSGNGNNGTISGAVFMDDGTGGATGTNASITGVIATSTADATAPVITSQQQAAITGIIANTTADAVAPTISTQSSVSASVDVIAATLTADAVNPVLSADNTIASIAASAVADTVIPTLRTDNQIVSPVGSATADAPSPSVSLSGNISVITVIADAQVDAINPTLSTGANILGTIGTASADTLIPSVGSMTNITVNAVIVSASVDGVGPNVTADRSIVIAGTVADASADAFTPMIGLSSSVQITATVTSITADGLAPSISTQQGTRIDTVAAELTVEAVSPTIQTDAIISAFIADVLSTGLAPIINRDAIPEYREVIQIVLNITRTQNGTLDIARSQSAVFDITQRMQGELKL